VISSNAISVITTMGIFAPAVTEECTGILASRGFTNIRWRFSAQLLEYGDDSRLHTRDGNPQKLSHCHETPENPPRVWTFKRLPTPAAE
jgi:hypothetical protein